MRVNQSNPFKPLCRHLLTMLVTLGVMMVGWSSVAHRVAADEGRDNAEMISLFTALSEPIAPSVAQVISGGRAVSLATVVSSDGYLITKRSELTGDPIRVRLSDNRIYPGRVAAVRRNSDLALIRIQANLQLIPAKLVNIRSPVASFLISVGRKGKTIGVGVVGVQPRRISHRAVLGVQLQGDSEGRAVVAEVKRNSGAAAAGIEPGDLIVAVNDRPETNHQGVRQILGGMFPGERVRLKVLRPSKLAGLQTLELSVRMRDLGRVEESDNDRKVNGPRSERQSGFEQVFQHDTVLDPDQCGGPVIDTQGQVIGVNIARAGRVISYALPSSLVKQEVASMLAEARSSEIPSSEIPSSEIPSLETPSLVP